MLYGHIEILYNKGKNLGVSSVIIVMIYSFYSSRFYIGQLLNLSRLKTHAFLKKSGIYLNYDETKLEKDLATLKQLKHHH